MTARGSVTTVTPTPYVGIIRVRGQQPCPPGPTPPTVGQIWPRGNRTA